MDWEKADAMLEVTAGTLSHPDRLLVRESEAVKEPETVERDTPAEEKLLDTWLCQSGFDWALVRVQ